MAAVFSIRPKILIIQLSILFIWGGMAAYLAGRGAEEEQIATEQGQAPVSEVQPLPSGSMPRDSQPTTSGGLSQDKNEPAPTVTLKVQHNSLLSDGLLEGLLIEKVYQQDRNLQKLTRKLTGVTTILPFMTGTMLSSTSLTQNIMALRLIDRKNPTIRMRKAIPTLGIVGQSTLLSSLTVVAVLRVHYNHQIRKRKRVLKGQVSDLLNQLQSGKSPEQVQQELSTLAGENASREFIDFWKLLYLKPGMGPTPGEAPP